MEQSPNVLPPTYHEIISEIGAQLNSRKKLILTRTLFIVWPVLALILTYYIIGNFFSNTSSWLSWQMDVIYGWILFSFFWGIFAYTVFDIEKRIWIDSYFDNKNLEQEKSWQIAKKLFWPTISLQIKLFLRFFLLPILALVFIILFALVSESIFYFKPIMLFLIIIIGFLAVGFYVWYVQRIKLRYFWFLFLDNYGKTEYSFTFICEEMKKMNDLSRSETFKKALLVNLGADTLEEINKAVINLFSGAVGIITQSKMLGELTGTYTRAVNRQVMSFGTIIAMYLLYRIARQTLYGSMQEVNENIYTL